MSAKYYCVLKDQAGKKIAYFDNWFHLAVYKRVNEPGSFNFVIDGTDSRASLFKLDCQFEVYRSDIENDLDWYVEFEGFCRKFTTEVDDKGKTFFTVGGVGYLDLLDRRIIAYKSAHVRTQKNDVGETVIKEFVNENAGANSLVSGGRLRDGNISELSIQADTGLGSNWKGQRSYEGLLKVCQEVSQETGIDFDVIGVGANLYNFRTYENQRGVDRTNTDIDLQTGKNSSGQYPIIFSIDRGNMGNPKYDNDRLTEKNVAFIAGSGVEDEREIEIVVDADSEDDSPLNTRETKRDARNQDSDELESVGDNVLSENNARVTFTFTALRASNSIYGKDYNFGDMITSYFGGVERNDKVSLADIFVDSGEDRINIRLGTLRYD